MTDTTRRFSFSYPTRYQGQTYPTAEADIDYGNGTTQQGRIFADANGVYHTLDAEGNILDATPVHGLDEVVVTAPRRDNLLSERFNRFLTESNDNAMVSNTAHRQYNTHLEENALQGAKAHALWDKEHPNLSAWRDAAIAVPLAGAAAPFVVGAGKAVIGTAAGQAARNGLVSLMTNPIVDAASSAANLKFAWDAGKDIITDGKFTPGTAMDILGGVANPRVISGIDVARTALTGKSRDWMKPLVKNYIGESYYNNIRPSGYANNDTFASDRGIQVRNMVKDILKPKLLQSKVSDPDYMPNWFVDSDNPTVFEVFRNDAHRLSMGLKPHKELLPDGKYHTLYVEKPNGNYDVDWDYIRHIKQHYADTDGRAQAFIPTDFPKSRRYIEGTSPSNGSVVSNDRITLNGGFGTYSFNPDKLYPIDPSTPHNPGRELPTHFSTGDVTFTDTWDVQPLMDGRSVKPGLTTFLTNVENGSNPTLSRAARNVKNVELVDALGGKPFTQESLLPDMTIYWYKPKVTLEKQLSKNKDKFQTLNW